MKIVVLTRGEKSHSYKYEMAFVEGLRHTENDVSVIERRAITSGEVLIADDVNLVVMWSARDKRFLEGLRNKNIDYLILERGYIGDREEYTSCGFNGLNGKADFVTGNIKQRRFNHLDYLVQPYRQSEGDYILVMGQVASDASVSHIGWNMWVENTVESIKNLTNKKVYYRVHPLDKEPFYPNCEVIHGDLHDVIKKAHCVVTLNSNSGVDCVLAGIPTIAMDKGSMAWDVTNNHLNAIIKPEVFDRGEWFNRLTYCQWTIGEMKNGEAWRHLRGFYEHYRRI